MAMPPEHVGRVVQRIRGRLWLAAGLCLCAGAAAPAWAGELEDVLAQARSAAPHRCGDAGDSLVRALCTGRLRVGVRSDYPPFGQAAHGEPEGFEPALARVLAGQLNLVPQFSAVDAADRIAALGEDRVDMLVATTGHTVARDGQVLFVRPHYYQSRTIVIGRRSAALGLLDTLPALAGWPICVTVGNATNAELAVHGARLVLYGTARQLVEQVQGGSCALAAHDDSLLLPVLPAGYEVKLGFSPLPWGVAVRRDAGASLAHALGLILQRLHADGSLLRLARQHGVATPWLATQQARWAAAPCSGGPAVHEETPGRPKFPHPPWGAERGRRTVPADCSSPREGSGLASPDAACKADDARRRPGGALTDPRCVDPPHDNRLAATAISAGVARLEAWLERHWGWQVTLAMLKTEVALRLFLAGMGYSLALAAGAVSATVLLALGFGAGLAARRRLVRWPLRGVLLVAQSTPMVLLMLSTGVLLSSAGLASPALAWMSAVLVLGLFNGSNAGQAVVDARASLLAEGRPPRLRSAAWRARAQIAAFAVNATRGTPAASLIGVPELLSALTDIASFSSERITTFTLLLVFYMALVSVVTAVLQRLQRVLFAGGEGP